LIPNLGDALTMSNATEMIELIGADRRQDN
jgi:hypothetical protein